MHEQGERPQRHVQEERPVGHQDVGGRAALLLLMHEIKIAEDPVEHERDGPGQAVGLVLLHRVRGHRVERVRGQAGGRHHRDHLVEEVGAVLGQDLAMAGGGRRERDELVPPLGQGQEEREQQRAHEQPVADLDGDGHAPRHRAQDEAEADGEHVQDHDLLQPERIEDVEERGTSAAQARKRSPRSRGRGRGTRGRGPRASSTRRPRRERAAGDRPQALARMKAVALQVGDVVEQVDRSRTARRRSRKRGPTARSGSGSKRCLESAGAANTTRFFVHWWGRSESQTAWTGLRRRGTALAWTGRRAASSCGSASRRWLKSWGRSSATS